MTNRLLYPIIGGVLMLFICINVIEVSGQNRDPKYYDSLKLELNTPISIEQKIDIYNSISLYSVKTNIDSAEYYAGLAFDNSVNESYLKGKCQAYINYAQISIIKGSKLKVLEYLELAEILAKDLSDDLLFADVLYTKGLFYYSVFKYDLAVQEGMKCYQIYRDANSEINIAKLNNFFGGVYADQGYYDKSINHVSKSLDYCIKHQDTFSMGVVYLNLGIAYLNDNNLIEAEKHLNESLIINERFNILEWLSVNYQNLGILAQLNKNYEKAHEYYNASIKLMEKQKNIVGLIEVRNSIGELCMIEGNLDKAEEILEKSNDLSLKNMHLKQYVESTYLLSQLSDKRGDHSIALQSYKTYLFLKDSLQSITEQSRLITHELLLNHKNEQLSYKIEQERLKTKAQMLNYFIIGLSIIVIFLVIIGLMQFKLAKQKDKSKFHEMRLIKDKLELRNRELTINAFNMMKSNEKTKKLVEIIEKHLWKMPKKESGEIKSTINEINDVGSKDFWKDFEIRFTQVHNSFYKNLRDISTELTPNEIKVCTFLKLNMSTKDISELINRSPSTVEVYRTRIRKKLNLTNQDINLQTFLSKL